MKPNPTRIPPALGAVLAIASHFVAAAPAATSTPIGFAAVGSGTTGGGGGEVVSAQTFDQLEDYAGSDGPLTILVEGELTGSGKLTVASDKTIVGLGADAAVKGAEFGLSGVSNIIIRNLTISGARDAIALRRSHHVWVDHCHLTDCGDGLLDVTNQSDLVTVSWTRFSNHHKTMLINNGTDHPEDAGTLNTTIHHCWFDGTDTRNPRAGYGKVHIFNCYYSDNGYGIGLHSQCLVRAERNFFRGTKDPIKQMYRPDPTDIHHGFCESVDNIFEDCSGARDDEGKSFAVGDHYLYDFCLDGAAGVPEMVAEKAGPAAEFGVPGPLPVPGNGACGVNLSPTLTWTPGREAEGYRVAFGDSNPPGDAFDVDARSFEPGTLEPGKVYYWRVDRVTADSVVEGAVWRFCTASNGE